MSLADLAGQPVVERRGRLVRQLEPMPQLDEIPPRAPAVSETVESLCRDLRGGITSAVIGSLAGIPLRRASSYLCRLQARGVLKVYRLLPAYGKYGPRMKVYRVAA